MQNWLHTQSAFDKVNAIWQKQYQTQTLLADFKQNLFNLNICHWRKFDKIVIWFVTFFLQTYILHASTPKFKLNPLRFINIYFFIFLNATKNWMTQESLKHNQDDSLHKWPFSCWPTITLKVAKNKAKRICKK